MCLSVRPTQILSRSLNLHLSLRSLLGLSHIFLRSLSDLSQVSLGSLLAFLAYFVGPTEPKILRLVVLDSGYFFFIFL